MTAVGLSSRVLLQFPCLPSSTRLRSNKMPCKNRKVEKRRRIDTRGRLGGADDFFALAIETCQSSPFSLVVFYLSDEASLLYEILVKKINHASSLIFFRETREREVTKIIKYIFKNEFILLQRFETSANVTRFMHIKTKIVLQHFFMSNYGAR